jgi:hypothetical protein
MEVKVTLKPGQNGTKRLVEHYGDQLVCVRYRIMDNPRLNANPQVDAAHRRVSRVWFQVPGHRDGLLGDGRSAVVYRALHARFAYASGEYGGRMAGVLSGLAGVSRYMRCFPGRAARDFRHCREPQERYCPVGELHAPIAETRPPRHVRVVLALRAQGDPTRRRGGPCRERWFQGGSTTPRPAAGRRKGKASYQRAAPFRLTTNANQIPATERTVG